MKHILPIVLAAVALGLVALGTGWFFFYGKERVVRRGALPLADGRARLYVDDIAPVAHDVSLQVSAVGATGRACWPGSARRA